MEFQISDKKKCETFIHIFANLKYFTDNVLIRVDEEKMYIQGMDNSHVCVYELTLDKSWFSSWQVPEPFDFGVFLPTFNKIIHTWSEKQTIEMCATNADTLDIEFTSEVKGEFDKFFQLPLMDIECDVLGIPDTEYEADITLESDKLKHIIGELASFNDTIQFNCNEERLDIYATSSEGSMKVTMNVDDIEQLAVVEGESIEASFSIKYIANMCQFYKISPNCTIHMSKDVPIKFKYEIADACSMVFYLAPKITDV